MSEEVHATLRADVGQFRKMIERAALDGETEHDDLYLNILPEEVRILQQAPGEVVLTYCTYEESFFDELTLEREVREFESTDSGGNDFPYRVGAEVVLNVGETLQYLSFASDGGTVQMDFTGEGEARLSAYLRATGALKSWVNLPGSESTIENVPHWLPLRFSANEVYTNQAGDEAPVKVETKVSKLQKIIEVVDADRDAEYRPISVQLDEDDDWDLQLDVGDESRSGVSGALGAKSVENKTGSPVENYYFDGFDEIVNVLGNGVELQTAPGGNPCAFVQRNGDHVIRHVNGTVSQG